MSNASDEDLPSNPQVMLVKSSTASAKIEKSVAHRVFLFGFPPLIEDCTQEESRARIILVETPQLIGASHACR